jgi:hypothetical protein
MYSNSTPANTTILANNIASFFVSAGFNVTNDNITLVNGPGTEATRYTPGSGSLLYYVGSLGVNTPFPVQRLVFKDPSATCYHHMLFYSLGNTVRDGYTEPTVYVDYYLSTDFDSEKTDDQTNLIKAGMWYSLPTTFAALDLFAGTNSEGKLWAHIAVEEKPMIYHHFGFGSIEKFLNFTGGDYISGGYYSWITTTNAGHATYGTWGSFTGIGAAYPQSAMYCPNLDAANKIDSTYNYRLFSGPVGTSSNRPGVDFGYTSLRVAGGATSLPYVAKVGGELSPVSFPMPNSWSGTAPLLPIIFYAINGKDLNYAGPAGYFKGVRVLNIANFNPRDEISLGPDTWKVYPVRAKQGIVTYHTLNTGFAILKNG